MTKHLLAAGDCEHGDEVALPSGDTYQLAIRTQLGWYVRPIGGGPHVTDGERLLEVPFDTPIVIRQRQRERVYAAPDVPVTDPVGRKLCAGASPLSPAEGGAGAFGEVTGR